MIIKKRRNIKLNEDFDFSTIEIEGSPIDNYRLTPELVRTEVNSCIDLESVWYSKFNIKLPRGIKYKDNWKGVGPVLTARDIHTSKYLTESDKALLRNAGFKEVNWSENIEEYPDVVLSIIRNVFGYTGDFSDNSPRLTYFLSEDGGIIVIDVLVSNPHFSSWQCIQRIICYTGDVEYKVVKKDVIKRAKNDINMVQTHMRFLNALLQRDKISLAHDCLAACQPVRLANGIIYIINERNPNDFSGYDDSSLYKCMWLSLLSRSPMCDTLKELTFPNQNENSIIGATTDEKLWTFYSITDKKILNKMFGSNEKIVDKLFNDNTTITIDGLKYLLYRFLYITAAGMKYYNAFMNKSVSTNDIKNKGFCIK